MIRFICMSGTYSSAQPLGVAVPSCKSSVSGVARTCPVACGTITPPPPGQGSGGGALVKYLGMGQSCPNCHILVQEKAHIFVQSVELAEDDVSPYSEQEVARDMLNTDPQKTLEKRFLFSLFSSSRTQAATLLFVNYLDHASHSVTFCGAHTLLPQTPITKLFQVRPLLHRHSADGHFGSTLAGGAVRWYGAVGGPACLCGFIRSPAASPYNRPTTLRWPLPGVGKEQIPGTRLPQCACSATLWHCHQA